MERICIFTVILGFTIALLMVCIPIVRNSYQSVYKIHCSTKYKNPEKFPNLFYEVVNNRTFNNYSLVMFRLKLPSTLNFESKLVAASDTLDDVCQDYAFPKYPFNVSLVYGAASTRNITIFYCFESSIIFNELIQMNIMPMLQGAYVTLIYTGININDHLVIHR